MGRSGERKDGSKIVLNLFAFVAQALGMRAAESPGCRSATIRSIVCHAVVEPASERVELIEQILVLQR